MSRNIIRCLVVAGGVAVLSAVAGAQTPDVAEGDLALLRTARASTMLIVGGSDSLRVSDLAPNRASMASVVRRPLTRAETLMIVGGAALVSGIIVGDDAGTVLILAGAGIGGYGLYLFLQTPDTRLQR